MSAADPTYLAALLSTAPRIGIRITVSSGAPPLEAEYVALNTDAPAQYDGLATVWWHDGGRVREVLVNRAQFEWPGWALPQRSVLSRRAESRGRERTARAPLRSHAHLYRWRWRCPMTTMPTIRPTLVDYLDQLLAIASAIHQCECVMRDARDARREAVHAFWNSDDADERAEHEHERGALDEYLTEQRANMALLYREKARLDRVLCTLNGCPADAPRRACPTIAS